MFATKNRASEDAVTTSLLRQLLQETALELKQAFKEELGKLVSKQDWDPVLDELKGDLALLRQDFVRGLFTNEPLRTSSITHRRHALGPLLSCRRTERAGSFGRSKKGKMTFGSLNIGCHSSGHASFRQGLRDVKNKVQNTAASAVDTVSNRVADKAAYTVSSVTSRMSNGVKWITPAFLVGGSTQVQDEAEPERGTYTLVSGFGRLDGTQEELEVGDLSSRTEQLSSAGANSDVALVSGSPVREKSSPLVRPNSRHNHTAHSKLRDMNFEASSDEEAEDSSRLRQLVDNQSFHGLVSIFILVNAVVVGIGTDYMARYWQKQLPFVFVILEALTCIFFVVEMSLRLAAYRSNFFTSKNGFANVFDLACTVAQSLEVTMIDYGGHLHSLLAFMRTMRLLRLFRSHVFVQIPEFRTILVSMVNSLKSLFWALLVILLVVYIMGIGMTQVATGIKIKFFRESPDEKDERELDLFFGTLPRSMMSLYQAVSDGCHWHELIQPLEEKINNPMLGILFSLYMAFMLFAMMNVITGHIVEGAFAVAETDKRKELHKKMRQKFNAIDDGSGKITWENFSHHLQHDEATKRFFKDIELDEYEAISLFYYLDKDHEDSIYTEHFVEGCTRFRGPAKVSHIMAFMEAWQEHANWVEMALQLLFQGEEPETSQIPTEPVQNESSA